jgi:ketosteroid isomerase-like protein
VSEENVALVKGMLEAGYQIDRVDQEEFLAALPTMVEALCHPEVEWVEAPERVDARTFHGIDGMVESFRRWLEDFDEYKFEGVHYEDHGNRVLVEARESGRGSGSGATIESTIYCVFTLREGKLLRYEEFYEEAAAQRAAAPA